MRVTNAIREDSKTITAIKEAQRPRSPQIYVVRGFTIIDSRIVSEYKGGLNLKCWLIGSVPGAMEWWFV